MIARAPGKLVVSGAYSVLEGAPAIVAAVDRYVTADSSRQADRETDEVHAAMAAGALRQAPWFDASALRMRLADGRDVKLGLGSSAAILVASIAAAWAAEDRTLEPRAMFQAALAAHRKAQGGGSGIDVAASSFGGVIACTVGPDGLLSVQPHTLPAGTRVGVFASPVSASTPELVGRVRAFAQRAPEAYAELIGEASQAAARVLEAGSVAELVAHLRTQSAALAALGEAAGAPIFTPDVLELGPLAEEEGGVFYPSGAGGGDVALFVGAQAPSDGFRRRAEALGRFELALSVGAPGVQLVSMSSPSNGRGGALSR